MKIKNEYPPVYEKICKRFGIRPVNTFYTYGDTIYNPDNLLVPDYIVVHEEVHMRQQNFTDAESWWNRYLDDVDFRIDQEAKAYAMQYDFMCKVIKDREQRLKIRNDLGKIMSGPIYNNVISQSEATALIKKLSSVK